MVSAMTDDEAEDEMKAAIAAELVEALRKLGAKSDLLGLVGSYGDSQSDERVLEALRRWNKVTPG